MKKILIHAHIFYEEMWPQLASCIGNVDQKYDLYVTVPKNRSALFSLVSTSFPQAKIVCCENRGYDIAPFIEVLNQVNLDDYSYIIKIHTKRDMDSDFILNGFNLSGGRWREKLLSFISHRESFKAALEYFHKHPKVGMLTDKELIFDVDKYGALDSSAYPEQKQFIKQHGWKYRPYYFVAGAMFIARAQCFRKLQGILSPADFPMANSGHTSQLAHVVERVIGYAVYNEGYIIDFVGSRKEHIMWNYGTKNVKIRLHRIGRFFYQKKLTKSGRLLIKIAKIPVFSYKRTQSA